MKIASSDGQLSIDNMDAAPIKIRGGSRNPTRQDRTELQSITARK